jgi:hypothetical protein
MKRDYCDQCQASTYHYEAATAGKFGKKIWNCDVCRKKRELAAEQRKQNGEGVSNQFPATLAEVEKSFRKGIGIHSVDPEDKEPIEIYPTPKFY